MIEDVEGLGQHVIRRNRLQRRDVEAAQDVAQALVFRRGGGAGERGGQLVAGVEQHGAAALHEGVEARDCRVARHRHRGVDGEIDQRIEGEFVILQIEADRFGRFQRGAALQVAGQAPEAGGGDLVGAASLPVIT
jgi:hypothetical protein